MSGDFDMTEVFKLAEDFGDVTETVAKVRSVVRDSAEQIKQTMRREAAGHKMAPGLPATITFDTKVTTGGIEAEIGPVSGGPGSLAFYYYGNSRVGPSIPDPQIALDGESEMTADKLGEIGEDILGRR